MTEVAERIADLSEGRRRLLARLRRERRLKATARAALAPRNTPEGTPLPLSFAQRRLWFVHQLGGDDVAYSAPVVYRVRGELDLAALDTGVRTLLQRHAALRTVFPERDGEPVQVVRPVPDRVLRVESVAHLAPADREAAAAAVLRAEVQAPFDLAEGPVVRVLVIEIGPRDHLLVLNIHHITSDQWSMGVVVRELAEVYAAAGRGREPELTALPVSYADYALWQREQMSGERLAHDLAYWRDQLTGLPELDLPTDRPRPAAPSHRGGETSLWLPPELLPGLRRIGEAAGTSPFMTLLAGWFAVLSRYTGETDIGVGTTSAGREADEADDLAGLVGFFVNTLVLRADTGDVDFTGLLGRVRESVLNAHRHGDVPFDLVVEDLRPDRDPSRPPLVSVMFQQDNTPDCALRLEGADVRLDDDFATGTAKYDLLVSVRVWDDTARVHVQYSSDLFDGPTVDRMLRAYATLLGGAVHDPAAKVHDLPLLPADERATVLEEWNDTAAHLTADVGLQDAFARQAAEQPDAVAAVAGGREYHFAELDQRANQLAHHLISRGVHPGTRVALHLRPGVDTLVAVLATLKSGGAFVPIDPGHPPARVDFVLRDCGASLVLTSTDLAGRIEEDDERPVVLVDVEHPGPACPPPRTGTTDDPCYVIYTSGTTGTPKGVVLRHRGVVNNLADLNHRFGVGPGDRVLALSSPGFDMSVYELLGVPGAGGTVIFPEQELLREPSHWADLIADHGVTVWNSAPALLELLLDHVEQSVETPGTLRLALLGGDWVPLTMPDRLRALTPGLRFVALGGATEVSIHSTVHEVGEVDPARPSIPYGRPLANQRAYVLDAHGQPLPVGVPGELYLGGVGVGAGYLGRPELSAEKFVHELDQRLYRTGDLARWRPDGELELLGRTDFMLKVNGLRIEPGEVEAALREHPAVSAAVVVAPRSEDGHRRLVGHLLVDEHSWDDAALASVGAFLDDRLPGYLVPRELVVHDAFPLTPNGKVDRQALTGHHGGQAASAGGEPPVGPVGPVEERIAAVFAEVLGRPVTGRHDDFFALGGDSFRAVRAARLADPGLPLVTLFRHPTPAALAPEVTALQESSGAGPAPRPLIHRLSSPGPARVNLVCVPYGGGNTVAYQPLAQALAGDAGGGVPTADVALWSVDLPGHDLSDERSLEPVADVMRRCAAEIVATVTGPVALYGQCAGTAATLVLARELEAAGRPAVATFMGAALPDPDPEASWNLLNSSDDDALFGHMRALGGFDGVLAETDVADILRVVRHDLTQMVGLFRAERGIEIQPVSGPVHCIVGADDPATERYAERYQDWGRYGSGTSLAVVPGGGHYFCKLQPEVVAGIVGRRLADEGRLR
jgi:amino acid adenylation domain-containing protein